MKKLFLGIFLVLICVFVVNADSNGIWHFAKDIRGGIFGSDEDGSQTYTFNNNLFLNNVYQYGTTGIQFKNDINQDTLFISNDGKVGIGTSSPSQALEVNGNIKALAYYHSSDKRLKQNIKIIDDPVSKIKQLDGVYFDWKSNNVTKLGLIAQDVEKVIPEVIAIDDSGYKSVEYANLVALLIEVVKEQQSQIDELKIKCD